MYIPKELICFILGFVSFPIVCYIVYVLKYKNKEDKENEKW